MRTGFALLSLLLACNLSVAMAQAATARTSAWLATISERDGLPAIDAHKSPALSAHYAFWGRDWKWADQVTKFAIDAPFAYSTQSSNADLNLRLVSQVKRISMRELRWTFDLDARSTLTEIIGGGMVFSFDASYIDEMGKPELLPGNRGWRWGKPGGRRVEMQFEPPLANVFFEQRRQSEIRAFFFQGALRQGQTRYVATLRLEGEFAVGPGLSERFGLEDSRKWPIDTVAWNALPVDLSMLNAPERPAGKRGFVRVRGSRLVFEDGTEARFWGTNLSAGAIFQTRPENVIGQARRLSALGFNLVRMHHHDSHWLRPNLLGERGTGDGSHLSGAMLERLDRWIAALKAEGVYVWLDLHVQRHFGPDDGITAFEEISKGASTADLKGYNYVNPDIRRAMKRFNEAYLDHLNPHTGRKYRDEPAIAAMLITNENDVTNHFGNALLPDKKVPWPTREYLARANHFADRHGLARDRVWRSWENGPSKLFLNDLEREFNEDMLRHLREFGVKVPVATTSTWGNPLSSLPALMTGDLIDVHAYGRVGMVEGNPLRASSLIHWIAAAQVANRPLTVTEWNVESYPAPDRHSAPLLVAAAARHQGWSALMLYAYGQDPMDGPGRASNWHAYNDPALLATLPAAALLFRAGHVREAKKVYAFAPAREPFFGDGISPANSPALRTAAESGKLVIVPPQAPQLPWLAKTLVPEGAIVLTDPSRAVIDAGARKVISDTGELTRDWSMGVYTIDTARTQAATGWIGGKPIRLADIELAIDTAYASVVVQSLDGRAIADSRSILVSLAARAVPNAQGNGPFHAEPVSGRLWIRGARGLKLRVAGKEAAIQALETDKNGRYQIDLRRAPVSHWLSLS